MSRNIIKPKLRFQILNRDNFECQYCGLKAGNGIHLQIDHKIPVKKGGDNSLDNLITSCFECNIGKGANNIEDIKEDLYKTVINQNTKLHIDLFFKWWNEKRFSKIDKNTIALLSILHTESLGGDNYRIYLSYDPINKYNKSLIELEKDFKLGGEYCQELLSIMEGPLGTNHNMTNEIDLFFEESLLNNNIRRAEAIENMSYRLNFELTKELYQLYIDGEIKNSYSIQKFSYFFNEVKQGLKE